MAIEATMRMLARLTYPDAKGMGLRINAPSHAIFEPVQFPLFTSPSDNYENIGTLLAVDPFTLRSQM